MEFINPYILQIIVLCGINIILTASLNLINGFTGQFSLGHAGFMAIGAYVSAALSVYFGLPPEFPAVWHHLLFAVYLLAGGAASALFGFFIGLPTLRLKGDYLAIVTLGFGEIIRVVILNLDVVGGARGFTNIPPMANFTWVLGWTVITLFVLGRLIYSVKGRAFMAVRDDEVAARSIGIPPTKVKVTAFVVGAAFAGIGGGLFAHFIAYLNPSSFSFLKSVEIVTMVVLGGMGSLTGSVISAVLLTALPEFLRVASEYRMVAYSLLIILIMILRPQGIMGNKEFKFPRR
ncbi:MAG: branched-chain amino acid ABC transporter permease [Deltaproteobacteria bacterium]|nr:branched-chain amino acid ABC transporter permease [Deltaproteobacteria bacterium]